MRKESQKRTGGEKTEELKHEKNAEITSEQGWRLLTSCIMDCKIASELGYCIAKAGNVQ